MKDLVYGAGVIGCYLPHILCRIGNDATVLARGEWKHVLETKGLTIRHHLQRKTTLDHPISSDRLTSLSTMTWYFPLCLAIKWERFMSKTVIGELMTAVHCSHAGLGSITSTV